MLTDNEIIKAAECFLGQKPPITECEVCAFHESYCCVLPVEEKLIEQLLDLINRQKAEIERLTAESQMADGYADALEEQAKAEAVKEFAERLKATFPTIDDLRCTDDDIYTLNLIDDLVKEFTEGEKK